jgi:WD40 repeat protein
MLTNSPRQVHGNLPCSLPLLLAAALASICATFAAAPPNTSEIPRLIQQLGSDKFDEREAASKALAALGEPAWGPLRKASVASEDLEIRRRARDLTRLIARRCFGEVRRFEGHTDQVNCAVLSSNGRLLLTGSQDQTIRLWDVRMGKELSCFKDQPGGVWCVALSADGKRALSSAGMIARGPTWVAGSDFTIRLWDLGAGKEIRQFRGHTNEVRSLTFSSSGRQALSASLDSTVRLWDVETGKELRRFEGHSGTVFRLSLSPDGRRVLSAGADRTVRVWDVETGKELHCFRGHAEVIFSLAWSPDGRRALSGSADGTLVLWDVEKGTEIRRLRGHTTVIWSVAFSPDGRRALSSSGSSRRPDGFFGPAGFDYVVRLWDVETGEELHQFEGHEYAVMSIAVFADGRQAISAGSDATVRLWNLPRRE